ncbi:MAG: fibronectin type III domain-containing protein, partial [Terracidiphilus sp.]
PSLNLPDRVTDLAATRAGDLVTLNWTMPKRNTDKLLLKGGIAARVCRREGAGSCEPTGPGLEYDPGKPAAFSDRLPPSLTAGAPRIITYFVELDNHKGRSAGASNGAMVLAGKAPEPVAGLHLEVRKEGVALHWNPDDPQAAIRLRRTLLTPPGPGSKPQKGPLAPAAEPLEQNLLVEEESRLGRALDATVQFGETYEYRAQRVVRVKENSQTLELDGELSAPVRIEVLDIFPPAVPTGLAAVATAPGPGAAETQPSVDLSWQPDTEADLAGYFVYRREEGLPWQRISPAQPVAAPAFHDAHVAPGNTYIYAVSAIDQKGHESARSAEAQETVRSQ